MIDTSSSKGKIVAAALRLAERQGWRDTGLDEIAAEAGISLAELRRDFQSKGQILAAFTRMVDDAVLAGLKPADANASPRDRLFDVIMSRFDAMMPYKGGLKRIAADLRFAPLEASAQLMPALKSQYWMLTAAGITAEGVRGTARVKALTALYMRVFGIWLEDDDPGMARTMAALDRRLRRGEDIARSFEGMCQTAMRFAGGLRELFTNGRAMEARPSPEAGSQTDADQAPAPGTPPPGTPGAAPSGA
jgi:AcrR family transcriptional regulator